MFVLSRVKVFFLFLKLNSGCTASFFFGAMDDDNRDDKTTTTNARAVVINYVFAVDNRKIL